MKKKYKYLFYVLLNVLVLIVPINCGRVLTERGNYTRHASRRQGGPGGPPGGGPGGPPRGGPGGPPPGGMNAEPAEGRPEEPDGEPGAQPARPPPRPAGPPENHDKPKPEGEEPTEDPDETGSEKTLHTVTDVPVEALDDALILDYGRYTTINFHYEAKQWMFSQPIDLCYDDYTKCYTSMIAPMPVCMMYSTRHIKTVYSYCDAYLYNCRIGYRYWRIVGYGKCIVAFFGFPALEDT